LIGIAILVLSDIIFAVCDFSAIGHCSVIAIRMCAIFFE